MTKGISSSAPNAAPESVAEKSPPVTAEERFRMIAEAAYFRAEKRAFVGGNVAEDWLQAEAEIDRMLKEQGRLPSMTPEEIEQRVQGTLATDPAAIAAQVRAITLDALTRGSLDTDALKRVTTAVVQGAREGAAPLGEHGGHPHPPAAGCGAFHGVRPRRGNHRDRLPQRGAAIGPLGRSAH